MKDSTFKKHCLVVDEWFVNGFNGVKAYKKFYPKSSKIAADTSVRAILENPRIKIYIDEKSENTAAELHITLVGQLKKLNDIYLHKDTKTNDKVNCIKEQNKLLALYKEHNEQKSTKIDLSIYTDEEIAKKLKEIANNN